MKKNIFKFAFVALAAATLSLSCQKEKDNDGAIQQPVMVSISGEEFFTNDAAMVKATLSKAIENPVTVTLAPGTKLTKSYTEPIDASLLTVGTITIPAGATEATATVSVNTAELPKGKYEAQIVATSCQGANMTSTSATNIVLLHGNSTVSLSYDDAFADDGTTTFTVSLDMYSEEDCVVTLGQLEFPGYENVPMSAFTFDKTVTIKAGETEATGNVAINLDAMYDSGFFVGALQITAVSEGKFDVSEKKFYTAAGYSFTASKRNHSIKASYLGRTTNVKGETVELFAVTGVNGHFDIFVTNGTAEASNSLIYPNMIAPEDAFIAKYISKYTLDQLCYSDLEGVGYATADKCPAGDYKMWVIVVTEDGCTGEYGVFDFTIEPEPEPTEAYSAWLGQWTVGSTAEEEEPVVITISEKDVNQSYYIDYLEGYDTVTDSMSATAEFNEDGTISIYAQTVGTWTHSSLGQISDVLAALIQVEDATYFVPSGALMATGVIDASGKAILTPGSYQSEDGTVYGVTGMKYYYVLSDGRAGAYTQTYTELPNSFLPVVEEPATTETGIKSNAKVFVRGEKQEHAPVNGSITNHILLK